MQKSNTTRKLANNNENIDVMLVLFDIGSDKRFSFVIAGVNYDVICSADNFQWKNWWNRENKKIKIPLEILSKIWIIIIFLMELLMDILLKEFDELELDSSPFCPSFCFAKKKKKQQPLLLFSHKSSHHKSPVSI
jgi:hypothetical protein